MKLFTNKEVQEEIANDQPGWSEVAIVAGYKYLDPIDRWILDVPSEVDYYEQGSSKEIVVSSSSLKYIDPESGGSPQAFLDFLDNGIEETAAMRKGTIIHKYHEDKDKFFISKVLKPTEKAGEVADKIIELVKQGNDYTDALVEYVVKELNYQSNWKMETRVKKIIEQCHDYINEVLTVQEDNLIYVTATELEPIQRACEAITKNDKANKLTFYSNDDLAESVSFKELELIFTNTFPITGHGHIDITTKCKIDNVIIDVKNKVIRIVDLKTSVTAAHAYGKSILSWSVYRQIAFYSGCVQEWLRKNDFDITDYTFKWYVIAVETAKLGQCVVYELGTNLILKGLAEIHDLYQRIGYHMISNNWIQSLEEVAGKGVILIDIENESQDNGSSDNPTNKDS